MSPRVVEVDDLDWTQILRPGDRVTWPQAGAEPVTVTTDFFDRAHEVEDLRCFVGIPAGRTWAPENVGGVALSSYTGSGVNRALSDAGRLEIVRVDYSALPELLSSGDHAVDVMIVLVPPPAPDGRFNLGLSAEYHYEAILSARSVIAEVSEDVPWTGGGLMLDADVVDIVVPSRRPLLDMRWPTPDEVGLQVAREAARWIEDGATLQLGIGSLPSAVLGFLDDRRDLGVHSGMVPDALVGLVQSGVVTGRRKTVDVGLAVAGALMGSGQLREFAHRHPALAIQPTTYTHDPAVLASQHRLTAVNAALQVDLRGRINAETIGRRYVGALGGARDFARGAASSTGGVSVTMLAAQSRHGCNVVEDLGDRVTLEVDDVGVVVTEFGSADLRGCSPEQRRERLLAIAGPGFGSDSSRTFI